MTFKKIYSLFAILVLAVNVSFSQNQGTIKGTLTDADSKENVGFATVLALNPATKVTIKSAQTNADGSFSMQVPYGVYTFKATFLGYQPHVTDSVKLSAAADVLDLGTIKLKATKGQMLNEVKVTAEKKAMELGIDKKIFSVDQSLVSAGGSASDLLQNVPSLQTDVDGNVTLRGAAPQVLINGKPSTIGGGDMVQILQSIPANSIDKVEIISNPSSKYDAAGESGIINIVLKKNAKLGLTGSANVAIGNRNAYAAGANLAFQNSKINIFGNYNIRGGDQYSYGFNNRNSLIATGDDAKYINQSSNQLSTDKNQSGVVGLDYYLADKTVVSLSGGINTRNSDENEGINFNYLNSNQQLLQLNKRVNIENREGNNYYVNLDLNQKFKKVGEELTFNFNYGTGTDNQNQNYTTSYYNTDGSLSGTPSNILSTTSKNNNDSYNIQADYVLPLSNGKFETGARSQIKLNNRDFIADSVYSAGPVPAYPLSNLFKSNDQVHAIYTNLQQKFGKFGYQAGLRLEKADLTTSLGGFDDAGKVTYTPGQVKYLRLYPSLFLSQDLGQNQQLQLSYSRRVQRPNPWFVNPFRDVSDPINIRQGNPNLLPEDIHSFELSYSKNWKDVTFISTAYYRLTNDVVQFVRQIDDEGITISMPYNFSKATNMGLELIGQVNVSKIWNFNANANLYQSNISGNSAFGIVDNSGFNWNANMTNNFKLPKNITLQVKVDYRSPQVMAQGMRKEMFGIDAGAKYTFMNNKASLSLNVRDIFKTRRFGMTTDAATFTMDFERYRLGQQGLLTFAYNFGNAKGLFKKSKKPASNTSSGDDYSGDMQ